MNSKCECCAELKPLLGKLDVLKSEAKAAGRTGEISNLEDVEKHIVHAMSVCKVGK